MRPDRPYAPFVPWLVAALLCALAILARQFLIQPPEVAHRCTSATLTLATDGPWWCSVRAALIMTYAWSGLFVASIALSLLALATRRAWSGWLALAAGLLAIVLYTYEAGAVAITIGALVLARAQAGPIRPDARPSSTIPP